jgi:Novel STAND NTPase 1
MPIAEHFAAECPSTEATRTFTLNAYWPEYPYPGLRPFRVTSSSDESLIFYGRNAQKDDILDRLNKAHTVFVLAPSGCGKPSLIKAGVIPALEAGLLTRAGHRWRSAEMRPGSRPLASLSKAFASILPEPNARVSGEIDDLLRSQPSGLWLAFECVRSSMSQDAKDWSLLLLLDQFEEVFGNQIVDRTEVDQLMRLVARLFCKAARHPYRFWLRAPFNGIRALCECGGARMEP